MAGWQIGLVITMAVGVAVILFGALWDRERHRKRIARLNQPPDRPIPGYDGDAPAYVTLNTPVPPREPALTDDQRAELGVRLKGAHRCAAPLASPEFVNDPPSGWAVLEHPTVLVCAEPVTALRELLPLLDRGARSHEPLVVAAPGFDHETLLTLIVNHLHHTLEIIAVVVDATEVDAIAKAIGGIPVSREDLRSGFIADGNLGQVSLWASSHRESRVLGPTVSEI